ncbi:uncharacterized protein MELLADRAFT_88494 [Melampsora larici-populina 98AG31]|uniref:Uncharacterized protein n=1 Tax=Melampsora larici-populina (strain 98AG31 / pathotype 3-4-7) TaxID=747676 RepID=F4RRX5_MELLP|nr:uncharacterized protein MELLADRAFT_88494 [Melampsora larici-populina 98AG31]EGG04755.1 hypothetical protein MELLADRAFT_88494 [Melampsora larici-populina 98AG31]
MASTRSRPRRAAPKKSSPQASVPTTNISRKRRRTNDAPDEENSIDGPLDAPDSNANLDSSTIPDSRLEPNEFTPLNDLPTLTNQTDPTIIRKWPQSRCKEELAKMRPKANKSISDLVQTEIFAAFQKWEHTKLMICLASNITLRMFNKEIGLLSPSRKTSDYVNYLQFSKKNHSEIMPQPSDDPESVQQLVERNKRVGHGWSELNPDERGVFGTRIMLALAGIPDFAAEHDIEDGEEDTDGDKVIAVPEVTKLTSDEEELYRPLYEKLVDHDVLVSKLGTAVPGITDKQFSRRSLRSIQKINQSLNAESHRQEFDYWLVAASTVPPLNPGLTGWCKVYTSMPVMSKYVTIKANFPSVFAAVAQGTSIINAVSNCAGANKPVQPVVNSTDQEKKRIRGVLLEHLTSVKVVGKKPRQGFPQGEDPQTIFIQRGIPARLQLDNGSLLTPSDLKLGFLKMNAEGRRKWEKDVETSKFRFIYDDSKLGECREEGEEEIQRQEQELEEELRRASDRSEDEESGPRQKSSRSKRSQNRTLQNAQPAQQTLTQASEEENNNATSTQVAGSQSTQDVPNLNAGES